MKLAQSRVCLAEMVSVAVEHGDGLGRPEKEIHVSCMCVILWSHFEGLLCIFGLIFVLPDAYLSFFRSAAANI